MSSDNSSSNSALNIVNHYEALHETSNKLSYEFTQQLDKVQQAMKQMSKSTAASGEVYAKSVQNLSKTLNESMETNLSLITNCDELDKELNQLTILSNQIQSVNKALDELQKVLF
ncbi:MAG: hypothetical protein EXX96DRAFT_569458 [Benjaminiella poitrasii]|nr:MAG: hypothetical protein EXX96DRAFT_569458 [Benjaminiella poitrasii]